ncbi:hypothetical protein NC651_035204 [Populus alba x Populus x berolinensis]|nr:hypothetical protein NC651_035204 [Populus alba x Populus x berolinensis]
MKAIDGPPFQATNLGDFDSNGEEELYMNEGLSLLFRVGKLLVFKDIVLGGVDPKPREMVQSIKGTSIKSKTKKCGDVAPQVASNKALLNENSKMHDARGRETTVTRHGMA